MLQSGNEGIGINVQFLLGLLTVVHTADTKEELDIDTDALITTL